MVNIANIFAANDPKLYSLGDDVVASNDDSNMENSLDGMSCLVDNSDKVSLVQNDK